MRLVLEDGTTINRPTDAQIAQALASLDWATDNSFAILEKGDWTYLQTAHQDDSEANPDGPFFVLEYQDGSLQQHFQAAGGPLALERIVAAFQQYNRSDDSWQANFQWEKLDLS